jgi:SAM-dependent methyltransferase
MRPRPGACARFEAMTDPVEHNRVAWNRASRSGRNPWCEPVGPEAIEAARRGQWSVVLTPRRPVPREWLAPLEGEPVLCLASGGGQQAPLLAAAGARVTSLDVSEEQLAKDAAVAEREGLSLRTVRGDMADLAEFDEGSFARIFHPVSNVFAPDVRAVWRECFRVLRPGGRLLAGFMNPDFYLFDHVSIERGGPMEIRFALPYSDLGSLDESELSMRVRSGETLEFSHSLDDQIGGQLSEGFLLVGFYEDHWDAAATPLDGFMPTSMATLALKP